MHCSGTRKRQFIGSHSLWFDSHNACLVRSRASSLLALLLAGGRGGEGGGRREKREVDGSGGLDAFPPRLRARPRGGHWMAPRRLGSALRARDGSFWAARCNTTRVQGPLLALTSQPPSSYLAIFLANGFLSPSRPEAICTCSPVGGVSVFIARERQARSPRRCVLAFGMETLSTVSGRRARANLPANPLTALFPLPPSLPAAVCFHTCPPCLMRCESPRAD